MTVYEVKILPEYYIEVLAGIKTYESRIYDRNYQSGDKLILKEWNGTMFTGRVIECLITDVYCGEFAKDGYCILSFKILFPDSEPIIPVKVYTELFYMYNKLRRECEALREEIHK